MARKQDWRQECRRENYPSFKIHGEGTRSAGVISGSTKWTLVQKKSTKIEKTSSFDNFCRS